MPQHERRSPLTRVVMLLIAATLALLPVAAASAAMADEAKGTKLYTDAKLDKLKPEQKKKALEAAQKAGAHAVCAKVPGVSSVSWAENKCTEALKGSFVAGTYVTGAALCTPLYAIPGIGPVINTADVVSTVTGRGFSCPSAMAKWIQGDGGEAFKKTLVGEIAKGTVDATKKVAKVAKFIANPANAIDEFANSAKEWATGLTQTILKHLTDYNGASLSSPEFLANYAASAGVGIVILAVMLLLSCWYASRGTIDPDELIESIFVRGPWTVLFIVFGPAIGAVLQNSLRAMTDGIAQLTGKSAGDFLSGAFADIMSATASGVPGGSLGGAFLFSCMGVGALGVAVGFVVQDYGLYMTSCVFAIAGGMRINPKWRPKARKIDAGVGALLLMKPAFMLLLLLSFGFLNMTINSNGQVKDSGWNLFSQLITVAAVFLMLAFAPFGIMRQMPLLPGGNEGDEGGSSGASLAAAGTAGVMLSQAAHARSAAASDAGSSAPTAPAAAPGTPGGTGAPGGAGAPGASSQGATTPNPPTRTPQAGGAGGAGGTSRAATAGAGGTRVASGGGKVAAGGAVAGVGAAVTAAAQLGQAAKQKAEHVSRQGNPRMGEAEEE